MFRNDIDLITWFLSVISGGERIIFIPRYPPSDHVLWLNDNDVEELFKMAFHSGSWCMFRVLERQPTWGLLKRCSVKQSALKTLLNILIHHLNNSFVNTIILANSVEISVFNLLVDCAEWRGQSKPCVLDDLQSRPLETRAGFCHIFIFWSSTQQY